MSNTPDQGIDDILAELTSAIWLQAQMAILDKHESYGDKAESQKLAKSQLKSLFETMMAEVVGDTPIPSEDDIWRYTDEGVGKFILLKKQRQRILQVITKYFGGDE